VSEPTPLVEQLEELGDPAAVAARFLDLPYLVLLDSASAGNGTPEARALARYSFLTADPVTLVRSKAAEVEVHQNGTWRASGGDDLEV
jgi:hypothetical protein